MNHQVKIASKFKAALVGLLVIAISFFGVTPAQAANFTATSASSNTAGTQVLLHTAVAIDPVNSAKVPANFVITVNGVARASTTYTVGFSGSDVVLSLTSGTLIYSDAVTVSYTRTGNNKIVQLGATNNLLSNTTTPLAVTNNVPAPDTTPPTFTAMTANTAGTNITVTYNEPLLTSSVPAASAFGIVQDGVTIPNTSYSVAISGSVVTITFSTATIVNNGVVNLSYAVPGSNQIKDLAGNAAAAIASNRVNNPVPDTTAPRVIGRGTNTAGDLVSIYFNEALSTTNVPMPTDFVLSINSVNYSSSNITVDITGSQVNLNLLGNKIVFGDAVLINYTHNTDPAKQIQDVAHNIGNSTANEIVTNNVPDLGAPVLDGRQTNVAGDQITVNYLSDLLTSSVPTPSEYSLTVDGVAYTSFTTSISGTAVLLHLTGQPITYGQAITISYSGTSVKKASNSVPSATFSNLGVDNLTNPGAAPFAKNGTTSTDGYYVYLNMSAPLLSSAVPDASDFLLEFDSAPYTGTFTVSVSGSTVTLHLSTPAVQKTYVEVSYTPSATPAKRLQSPTGVESAAWIDLDITNIMPDTQSPTVVSRLTNAAGTQIIITFSEQLCETCLPLTSDLYLVFDGTRYSPANYTMSITGATYTFTLTGAPITYGQTLRLSYVPNAIVAKRVQDPSGNLLPATTNAVITNLVPDTGAPAVTSKSTNPTGTSVTIAYNRPLDAGSVPAASDFALKVDGTTYAGGFTVAISGNSVVLSLTGADISAGAAVTLSYSGTAIQAAGLSAPMFIDNVVSSIVRPELTTLATDNVDGTHVYLNFNVPLNTGSVPAATDFTLTLNGVTYSSSNYSVSISGSTVSLNLTGTAIKQTDVVRLVYAVGSSPIQDLSGNSAAAIPLIVVSNRVPDLTAPENISLVTNLIGDSIIWTYNEPLDLTRVPLASDFGLTLDGVSYSSSNYTVGVSDSRVTLTLNGARIRFGQIVVLTYTPGLTGNQLADPAGNLIQSEPHATVLNLVPSNAVPTISSMVTDTAGRTIFINYNKALDVSSVPSSNDYVVSLNDAIIAAGQVSVSISDSTVRLNLSSATILNGVRVDVLYAQGSTKVKDLAGNFADGFEKTRVTNLVPDTTAPTVIGRSTNTAGNKVIITFSEPLNAARLPAATDIALVFDGVRYDPANYTMTIVGAVFTFTLTGPAIRYGQTLRLSYTRDVNSPNNWVQDLAGNLVPNSVSQSVDNIVPDTDVPTLVSAVTNVLGDKINLTYNYSLASGSVPAASDFVLRVNGSIYANSNYSVSISGSVTSLTLTGSPIGHGDSIALSYSGSAIRRSTNNIAAASFTNLSVTNHVPDTTAPIVLLRDEITIHLGDQAVTTATADDESTWSEALDESGYFSIDAVTGAISASSATPLGTYSYTVTATNDAGIQTDATISIMVRPVPVEVSGGGDDQSRPLPPLATAAKPVFGVTNSLTETRVVASIDSGLGLRVVSVLEPVGGVPTGATITIKPGPVSDESLDGRFTIEITVTHPDGHDITDFDKVFSINLGTFIGGALPAHSPDGKNWPTIQKLQGDWLPEGQRDGYYVDGSGNLIILARHMTLFGLKKDQQLAHDLRILTGETRTIVGGEIDFKLQGGLGAGQLRVESLTPELCAVSSSSSVQSIKSGTCLIRTVKQGDGVYADATSEITKLQVLNPSATMRVSGSIKALRIDLGERYAGRVVTVMMSTPVDHKFAIYRRVTLNEDGVKELRAAFDSHATFRVMYGKKIVVDAKAND
ncbi:MAG: beta strand repeat-containing protein [Rhodoluna sp.]